MKTDWRFTIEGDLELGSARFNEFGELLYVDQAGNISTDSSKGELIRDIPLSVSYMSEKQVIINRLKTDNPDWAAHSDIGSDLSELIGLPNTRETAKHGVELITKSLCADGFINQKDLSIRPIPISSSEMLFHITLARPTGDIIIPFLFNLEHGLITEYIPK